MPEMGEEMTGGSAAAEDAQAATNATPAEGASPAPAVDAGGDATPDVGTPVPESTGAKEGLTGDEGVRGEVEAYLQSKYAGKMTANDVEQVMRWWKGSQDSLGVSSKAEKLEHELQGKATHADAMQLLLAELGPGYVDKFQELGPAEFSKFITDRNYGQPEMPEGLSGDDPVHQLVATLQKTVGDLVSERDAAKQATEYEANQAAYEKELDTAIGSLGIKDEISKAHARVLLTGLYVDATLKDPNIRVDELKPELTKMMKAVSPAVSSEAANGAEEAKPVVPSTEAAPPSAEGDEEDLDPSELEDAQAMKNAAQPG